MWKTFTQKLTQQLNNRDKISDKNLETFKNFYKFQFVLYVILCDLMQF